MIQVWAARQDDGTIEIYSKKPILVEGEEDGEKFAYFNGVEDNYMFLETPMGKDFHSEVTMGNSPLRIELSDKDLVSILKCRKDYTESRAVRIGESGGLDVFTLCDFMAERYVLGHIIDLIEASIEAREGGEE